MKISKQELLDSLEKEEILGLLFKLIKEYDDNEGMGLDFNYNAVDGKYCFDTYEVERIHPAYENVEKGDLHYELITD